MSGHPCLRLESKPYASRCIKCADAHRGCSLVLLVEKESKRKSSSRKGHKSNEDQGDEGADEVVPTEAPKSPSRISSLVSAVNPFSKRKRHERSPEEEDESSSVSLPPPSQVSAAPSQGMGPYRSYPPSSFSGSQASMVQPPGAAADLHAPPFGYPRPRGPPSISPYSSFQPSQASFVQGSSSSRRQRSFYQEQGPSSSSERSSGDLETELLRRRYQASQEDLRLAQGDLRATQERLWVNNARFEEERMLYQQALMKMEAEKAALEETIRRSRME
jgi:hypothetical protein